MRGIIHENDSRITNYIIILHLSSIAISICLFRRVYVCYIGLSYILLCYIYWVIFDVDFDVVLYINFIYNQIQTYITCIYIHNRFLNASDILI